MRVLACIRWALREALLMMDVGWKQSADASARDVVLNAFVLATLARTGPKIAHLFRGEIAKSIA